jgi:hypothetical protein
MTEESQIVRDKFAAYSNITNKERPLSVATMAKKHIRDWKFIL